MPEDTNIELNISCPNVNKCLEHTQLFSFINPKRQWCIIKLSPLTDMKLVDRYYKQGFRQFHCSNTIPVKEGGLSGTSVVPSYIVQLLKTSKRVNILMLKLLQGGGIYDIGVYNKYKNFGANHYSISTIFLHPIKFSCFIYSFYNKKL